MTLCAIMYRKVFYEFVQEMWPWEEGQRAIIEQLCKHIFWCFCNKGTEATQFKIVSYTHSTKPNSITGFKSLP